MLIIYQNYNSSTQSISQLANNGDISGGSLQRRIGDTYYDDPLVDGLATDSQPLDEGDDQGVCTGSVVQPSRLHSDGNEWREV